MYNQLSKNKRSVIVKTNYYCPVKYNVLLIAYILFSSISMRKPRQRFNIVAVGSNPQNVVTLCARPIYRSNIVCSIPIYSTDKSVGCVVLSYNPWVLPTATLLSPLTRFQRQVRFEEQPYNMLIHNGFVDWHIFLPDSNKNKLPTTSKQTT